MSILAADLAPHSLPSYEWPCRVLGSVAEGGIEIAADTASVGWVRWMPVCGDDLVSPGSLDEMLGAVVRPVDAERLRLMLGPAQLYE